MKLDDEDHIVPVTRLDVEALQREMQELCEEMEEARHIAYEGSFAAMQDFLSGIGGWCEERGLVASTITPTGDEEADFLNMLRAMRGMADDILTLTGKSRQ
ncbi:hypothetical protein [Bosea sp. TND4EK4]|uniref:hypothetical protein n=1 Tax=Bosea sp. TND4EK4 TaxID=1907408 RepID=UPI001115798C|nr:hypothetical protein [Bosea sp. TND4EK4]